MAPGKGRLTPMPVRRPAPRWRASFTLIELLAVVAIVAVLAALSLPRLASARDRALQIGCASNMRNIHAALLAYAADHDGTLPPNQNVAWGAWWHGLYLYGYASADAFRCPADRTGYLPGANVSFLPPTGKRMADGKVSYGGMGDVQTGIDNHQLWGRKLTAIPNLAMSVLLGENQAEGKQLKEPWSLWSPRWISETTFPHAAGTASNVLFADGHITALTSNQFRAAVTAKQVVIDFP